jgi:sporulation protein YunB
MVSLIDATIKSLTSTAVNEAIMETLKDGLDYDDLIAIERDNEGNINAILADAYKINYVTNNTVYLSAKYLDESIAKGVNVPLGALSGVKALSGFGPQINIKLVPVTNVDCKFVSRFEQGGVNLTKHSIYLEVIADISVIFFDTTTNMSTVNDVLICENIIVGKVPDTFLQIGNLVSSGDLVP